MKTIHLFIQKGLFSLALVFALGQISFAQSPYSGQQLFAGIFFGDGPVAERVQVLRDFNYKNYVTDPSILATAKRFQTEITSIMNAKYPEVYQDLSKEIGSKDHMRIQECLARIAPKFHDALKTLMYSTTGSAPATSVDQETINLQKFVMSYFDPSGEGGDEPQGLIGLALVWVAVVAWEYLWVSDKFILPNRISFDGDLRFEQLIDSLAHL